MCNLSGVFLVYRKGNVTTRVVDYLRSNTDVCITFYASTVFMRRVKRNKYIQVHIQKKI